jgi:hypothetical protein
MRRSLPSLMSTESSRMLDGASGHASQLDIDAMFA